MADPITKRDDTAAAEPAPPEALDGVLGELVDLVGIQATLAIVERWGGIRMYAPEPRSLHPDHPLVEAVGQDAAEAIAAQFQSEPVLVPRAVALVRRVRNHRIRTEHRRDGDSAAVLARRYGLSLRQVRYILADDGRADDCVGSIDGPQFRLL